MCWRLNVFIGPIGLGPLQLWARYRQPPPSTQAGLASGSEERLHSGTKEASPYGESHKLTGALTNS